MFCIIESVDCLHLHIIKNSPGEASESELESELDELEELELDELLEELELESRRDFFLPEKICRFYFRSHSIKITREAFG